MFQLGLCQMHVTADKAENLRHAGELVRQAAADGAQVIVLPEMFNCPYANDCFPVYAEPAGGESWQALSALARELGIYLVGGSIPELEEGRIYNTCFVFDPQGRQIARHRKVHLFDIDVPGGQRFMESDTLTAGSDFTVFDTEYGRLAVAICFDIRFSDFFRVMGNLGAECIIIPAAFNMTTGPIHWDLTFRVRSLDQQCFLAGCSPARDTEASYVAYGHSLVCNPWGDIIAQAGAEEQVLVVEVDLNDLAKYRGQIPILAAQRKDLYRVEKLN